MTPSDSFIEEACDTHLDLRIAWLLAFKIEMATAK